MQAACWRRCEKAAECKEVENVGTKLLAVVVNHVMAKFNSEKL
jgi:hypothetical protein